jgi:outer membrane protein TolC
MSIDRQKMTRAFVAGTLICMLPLAGPVLHAQQATGGQTMQLSMDQAVAMALETNLGLKSSRLNLDIASQNIASARSVYRPTLSSSFLRNIADSAPSDFTQTGATVVSSSFVQGASQVNQNVPWYGGRYSASWSGSRTEVTNSLSPFNPTLSSRLTLSFTQPLWRNFRTDSNRFGVDTSERQYQITDLQLQQQIVQTQANVRQAYLRLIGAIASRQVAEQNMKVAQESLRGARAKINVGTAAEIDAIQSLASVATNEEAVIIAETSVSTAEDALRALMLDPARPDYWQVQIQPTDAMEFAPREIDVAAAIKNALANRLDLVIQRRSMEITDLTARLNEDQVRPAVDLSATYQASGTAGTKFNYGTGFPPPILSQSDRSYTGALGDTFGGAYPSWTIAFNVAYPIGQSAAHASLARTRIQAHQQQIDLQNLELAVTTSVRDAARQVQQNAKRVAATRAALEANKRQVDAEERKAAVGLSTTFDVLLKQSFLAQARDAELRAMIAYNQSLIDFDRIQRIR